MYSQAMDGGAGLQARGRTVGRYCLKWRRLSGASRSIVEQLEVVADLFEDCRALCFFSCQFGWLFSAVLVLRCSCTAIGMSRCKFPHTLIWGVASIGHSVLDHWGTKTFRKFSYLVTLLWLFKGCERCLKSHTLSNFFIWMVKENHGPVLV